MRSANDLRDERRIEAAAMMKGRIVPPFLVLFRDEQLDLDEVRLQGQGIAPVLV